MSLCAEVLGLGLWTPEQPTCAHWIEGRREAPLHRPACEGIPPTLLRGASIVTLAALDALGQAAREGGAVLAETATVFGSTFGEIQTAVDLSAMIRAEGIPSPMRFKNSVHNASAGIASIAYGATGFSTSISAGGDLVAMVLAECLGWLAVRGGDVIAVLAEEPLPPPLVGPGDAVPLALALHLRAGRGRRTLTNLRVADAPRQEGDPRSARRGAVTAALPLLAAITAGRDATIPVSQERDAPWSVDLVVSA